MAQLNPQQTTLSDLCLKALRMAQVLGTGQNPLPEQINDTWATIQWMLQEWERERFLVYHNVTYTVVSTGQITPYSVGPGGQFNSQQAQTTGDFNNDFNTDFSGQGWPFQSARPNRIESAFFAQLNSVPNGPVVYSLKVLPTMEDYRKLCLPNLTTFSLVAFYDPAWPTGQLYVWPWPQASIYAIGIVAREQLPTSFASLATVISLPYEYYWAIITNAAIAIRPTYGLGTFPGDHLPALARNSLNLLRKGNTAIAELAMPKELVRGGLYSIYSDQNY